MPVSGKTGSLSLLFPFPASELLEKGLVSLGFPQEDTVWETQSFRVRGINSIIPLVNRYLKELELFNAVFDLVGADTKSDQGRCDLVVRHILDSLSPWKEIASLLALNGDASTLPEVADAGSGAGFPGIPLSIIFPDIHFTLIERMSKRCSFLENCVAILGLKNVSILNSEVEKAKNVTFDVVVFRAFRPLDRQMVKTLLALTKKKGVLAAYKAKKDKIEEEMSAISTEVSGWKVLPLYVPFLDHEERHLVLTSSVDSPNQPN